MFDEFGDGVDLFELGPHFSICWFVRAELLIALDWDAFGLQAAALAEQHIPPVFAHSTNDYGLGCIYRHALCS